MTKTPRRNPRQLKALKLMPDNVRKYKRYDCEHYEACLDDVCKHPSWRQFHCNDCKAYVQDYKPFHVDINRLASGLKTK